MRRGFLSVLSATRTTTAPAFQLLDANHSPPHFAAFLVVTDRLSRRSYSPHAQRIALPSTCVSAMVWNSLSSRP